jgi:hypothetical protein
MRTHGILKGTVTVPFDTSALTEKGTVYVGVTGLLTTTKPSGTDYVKAVGVCLYQHATLGVVDVRIEYIDVDVDLTSVTTETITTLAPSSGAAGTQNLDLSLGRNFKLDCSTNSPTSLTLTMSNVPVTDKMIAVSVLIKCHASNAVPTITWPQGVTAPTLAINKTFWYTLATEADANTTRTASVGTCRLFEAGSF